MNEFFALWKQRAESEKGDYLVWINDENGRIIIPTSLRVAVAMHESLNTDTDFSPDSIEIVRNGHCRFAVAKGKPSTQSPLHDGYVISFGVTSCKHPKYKDCWVVYLS